MQEFLRHEGIDPGSRYRHDYVRREIRMHGFRSDSANLIDRIVREVTYAIWPALHEDAHPSYGAVVTNHWPKQFPHIPSAYSGSYYPCPNSIASRKFADGVTSFFVSGKRRNYLWIPKVITFSDEPSLFTVRDTVLFKGPRRSPEFASDGKDFVFVQRSASGAVLVMHWDGIIVIRNVRGQRENINTRCGLRRSLRRGRAASRKTWQLRSGH